MKCLIPLVNARVLQFLFEREARDVFWSFLGSPRVRPLHILGCFSHDS